MLNDGIEHYCIGCEVGQIQRLFQMVSPWTFITLIVIVWQLLQQ